MRKQIDLNGIWDFVVDLDPKYHLNANDYPSPPYASPKANRRHWQKVTVPGVWQKYAERYAIYEGTAWFAREFELNREQASTPARLCFGGVNYFTRVFLNGQEVGQHEGGYTPFVVDVTNRMKEGSNCLALLVDNRAVRTIFPPVLGYFNYGGIHRGVKLEILEGICFSKVEVSGRPENGGARLRISGSVSTSKTNLLVEAMCPGSTARSSVENDGTFQIEMFLPGTRAWSPQDPALYPIEVALSSSGGRLDTWKTPYGFKLIQVHDGKLYLNSHPFAMKGICYVYDSSTSGLVMTAEQIETDIALIKEMGCNTIRCHYPLDERFYEACDRNGILVWIEPPVYCYHPLDHETGTGFSSPDWIRLARQMIVEMIAAARNHPCVAVYGIGNECNTSNPEAEPFFKGLSNLVRSLDPSRLVSFAALYGNVGPIAEMVDILGINSYWGWYDRIFEGDTGNPEDQLKSDLTDSGVGLTRMEQYMLPMRRMLDQVIGTNRPDLALLLTEFGADSVPGFIAQSQDFWTEDYHAALLDGVLRLAKEYPQIAGTFPFCFSDYRDPSKVPNGYWNELNLKGVVTYERRKKLAFDAVKDWYTK